MTRMRVSLVFVLYLAVAYGVPTKKPDSKQPIYIRGRCPPNQMLYPVENSDDWVCDCGTGFLYHARDDKCYRIFRKGPCANGQYFTIERNKSQAECVNNPCGEDGLVQFKGTCTTLYSSAQCPPANSGRVLGVNYSTFELTCIEGGSQLNIIQAPKNSCPTGSKRSSSGRCRPEVAISD